MGLCDRHTKVLIGSTSPPHEPCPPPLRRNARGQIHPRSCLIHLAARARGVDMSQAGWCVFSQSFNASSILVCQPFPLDLNVSMTSGESRMLTACFVTSLRGLPRCFKRLSATDFGKICDKTSEAGRVPFHSASVNIPLSGSFNVACVISSAVSESIFPRSVMD